MLELKEIITFDGTHWAFRSDLVREVAYARLTKTDRLARHKGIATYLEAASGGRFVDDGFVDTVARHFGEAARLAAELGPLAEAPDDLAERALRWVGEAARRAEQAAAWLLAERLHDQALDLSAGDEGPGVDDLGHLLGRARARNELWRFDDARDDAALAVSLARRLDDREAKARALSILGEVEARSGRDRRGPTAVGPCGRRVRPAGGRARPGRGPTSLGHGRAVRARLRRSVGAGRRRARPTSAPQATTGGSRGPCRTSPGSRSSVVTSSRRRPGSPRPVPSSPSSATTAGWRGAIGLMAFVRFYQGRVQEARELGTQVLRESERRADRWGQGMMLLVLAAIDLWEGRTSRAEEYSQRSVGSAAVARRHHGARTGARAFGRVRC